MSNPHIWLAADNEAAKIDHDALKDAHGCGANCQLYYKGQKEVVGGNRNRAALGDAGLCMPMATNDHKKTMKMVELQLQPS